MGTEQPRARSCHRDADWLGGLAEIRSTVRGFTSATTPRRTCVHLAFTPRPRAGHWRDGPALGHSGHRSPMRRLRRWRYEMVLVIGATGLLGAEVCCKL